MTAAREHPIMRAIKDAKAIAKRDGLLCWFCGAKDDYCKVCKKACERTAERGKNPLTERER